MVATIEVDVRSLSTKPRYRPAKEFVEAEPYEDDVRIVNGTQTAFPPQDMTIDVKWVFPSRRILGRIFQLTTGQIPPGESFNAGKVRHKVLDPGFAMLSVDYRPYGQGCVLYDTQGREIIPIVDRSIGDFYAISRMELAARARLLVGIIAAALALIGIFLNILFRWI